MHSVYRTAPLEDIIRIVDYCRSYSVKKGGIFEIYPDPREILFMISAN